MSLEDIGFNLGRSKRTEAKAKTIRKEKSLDIFRWSKQPKSRIFYIALVSKTKVFTQLTVGRSQTLAWESMNLLNDEYWSRTQMQESKSCSAKISTSIPRKLSFSPFSKNNFWFLVSVQQKSSNHFTLKFLNTLQQTLFTCSQQAPIEAVEF